MPRIALATAIAAFQLDDDLLPLQLALRSAGADAEVLAWDDPTVSWGRFDLVLLRSTWDYTERFEEFLDWCERVARQSRLLNPLDVVRWNTDKRYLQQLHTAGAPVVESVFLAPGDDPCTLPDHAEFVVKPSVGAGSRGARRFSRGERVQAIEHAAALLAAGRHVLVQPYLHAIDEHGETALLFFEGVFSHAIRKAPLLQRGQVATRALFATEKIAGRSAGKAELGVARRVLDALPFPVPLYARVDLLPGEHGPELLELELTEPSLFFAQAPGSAARFAEAIMSRLAATA